MSASHELVVAEVVSRLTGSYYPAELLEHIVAQAVGALDVVNGALLAVDGAEVLHVVATFPTVPVSGALARLQVSGPALESARRGNLVAVEDLQSPGHRWPELVSADGPRGVRSYPLRLAYRPLGSLTLYADDPWGSQRSSVTGQALADLAALVLTRGAPDVYLEQAATHLSAVLSGQTAIEQASGVLAQHLGTTVAAGRTVLEQAARSQRQSAVALARRIIADPATRVDVVSIGQAAGRSTSGSAGDH